MPSIGKFVLFKLRGNRSITDMCVSVLRQDWVDILYQGGREEWVHQIRFQILQTQYCLRNEMVEIWTKKKTNENEISDAHKASRKKNRIQFHRKQMVVPDDYSNIISVNACIFVWRAVQFRYQMYHWHLVIMFDMHFNLCISVCFRCSCCCWIIFVIANYYVCCALTTLALHNYQVYL